jgi:hypothetical protein
MSFFASLGLKWDEFKTSMDGARAEVDKFSQKVNNKGMFADFQSRTGKLGDAARGIGQSLAGGNALGAIAGTEAALLSMGPVLGGVAAGAAVVGVAAMGMWAAMSKTKELTNLAAQSGITLVELMALEKAFTKAGASSEAVPATMAKLASAIGEIGDPASKAAQAFAMIGLNADSFKGKTQYEAYKMVSSGIEGLTSSTDKLIAKRALLGRGAPLIAGSAIEKAEKAVSPSAQMMQEYAPMFAMFQAQLGKLALSFTPFFVGMAASVIPQLMVAVEQIEKIDLTTVGQSFGDAIASAVVMLKDATTSVANVFEKMKAGVAAIDPKKGLFLSVIDRYRKGDEATPGGVELDQTKMAADAKAQLEKMGGTLAPKFENALPKVAASNKAGDEGFIGPLEQTTAQRAAEIKAEMLKKYEPKALDTGIDIAPMSPKTRTEAGAITTSLGKIGGGGNVFGGGGMDIPRQQLDEQKRSNQHLQVIAAALTTREVGLTPYGALA